MSLSKLLCIAHAIQCLGCQEAGTINYVRDLALLSCDFVMICKHFDKEVVKANAYFWIANKNDIGAGIW